MKRMISPAPAPSRDRGLLVPESFPLQLLQSRRRFLTLCAGAAAMLGLGTLPGCAEDPEEVFNPDNLLLLWLAQSMSGRVTNGVDRSPVSGAAVTFQATLDTGLWITQGTAVTNSQGNYSMLASGSPGGGGEPGAFWRFAVQESGEHTIFLRVTAGRSGVGSGSAQRSVKRVASKEPPRGTLAAYQLTQDVTLAL